MSNKNMNSCISFAYFEFKFEHNERMYNKIFGNFHVNGHNRNGVIKWPTSENYWWNIVDASTLY